MLVQTSEHFTSPPFLPSHTIFPMFFTFYLLACLFITAFSLGFSIDQKSDDVLTRSTSSASSSSTSETEIYPLVKPREDPFYTPPRGYKSKAHGKFLRKRSTKRSTEIEIYPLVKPREDPFYTPPKGYESKAPGTILRKRSTKTTFLSIFPQNLKESYQLLYRTIDSQSQPSHTVLTVLVPHNAKKGPEIVSFQNAEDSANVNCAPSYQLTKGGNSSNILTQIETLLMDHLLSQGRIVITPDYEGPLSGFVNGPLSATGVLDGIRAALSFEEIVQDRNKAKVALNGYSGGALATGWAIQQASDYAPELSFVGAAIGGLPVSIRHIFSNLNNGTFAGIAGAGIAGLMNTRPEFKEIFNNVKNLSKIIESLESTCITGMVSEFAGTDFYKLAGINTTELYKSEVLKEVLDSVFLGGKSAPVPQTPTYLYHAISDEIVVPEDIDQWADDQCKSGIPSLIHVRELVGEHISLQITGAAGAFNFLEKRFRNETPVSGCKTENVVTSLLDPLAIATFSETLLGALTSLLDWPIGRYF